ncbi:MAG: response regulator, partial [Spirochaetia bacterium]|nr:response regulator [Spirochaetia bacterium]
LKQLRNQKNNLNVPVIAISANALLDDIARGMDAGFIDYITKPIDINQLLEVVDAVLLNTNFMKR